MIRQQQLELQRLQASNTNSHGHGACAEDSSAISDRTAPPGPPGPLPAVPAGSYPRSPIYHHRPSLDMARADLHRRSRTPSRGASPRLRSTSISAESGDWALGGRDESAFYQAEAQMLTRENQMLKHRIHDLRMATDEDSATLLMLTLRQKSNSANFRPPRDPMNRQPHQALVAQVLRPIPPPNLPRPTHRSDFRRLTRRCQQLRDENLYK